MQAEEEVPIIEVPLIIQDVALLNQTKGMRLDEGAAFEYVKQITEEVEKVGGILTLLWHPNYIINLPWWNLYRQTLKYLMEKDVWFGTLNGVGEYGMFERGTGQ